jgi:hypothetical protein
MSVVALKQKPKGPSFGEALAQTATKTEAKPKKGKMPTIKAPAEVAEAVDAYQEAKVAFKQAEAVMDSTGTVIQEFVRQQQDQDGFAGKYQGSYAVIGNYHQAKVIFANKYSLSAEDEEQLAEILGENYDNLINKKFNVKLKSTVFEDEALQGELMDLVGERFADFFDTEVKLGVCDDFSKIVYQALPDTEHLENLRTFAKQYKPSIR